MQPPQQQQQQPDCRYGVVLDADHPMPVVSIDGVGVGVEVAATSQMNPMPQLPMQQPMSTVQQLPSTVLIDISIYLFV